MIYDKETLMIIQNAILVMKHYDNGEDVALTTSRNRLLDLEQKLLQHGVSGKRPDNKTIIAASFEHVANNYDNEMLDEDKKLLRTLFKEGAHWAFLQAACASGAVDKTVRAVCAKCGGTGIHKGGPTDSRKDEPCTCVASAEGFALG